MIFSPRSVHGSVHVGDSIPLTGSTVSAVQSVFEYDLMVRIKIAYTLLNSSTIRKITISHSCNENAAA